MKSGRIVALSVLLAAFAFNEWAFRFIFPLPPVDAFIRLMTLVLDGFILLFAGAFLWRNIPFTERLKNLLRQSPKPVAVFIGIFFAYCGYMALEFSCRYYFKHIYEAPYAEKTYWEPSAVVPDSILGTALPTDSVVKHTLFVNDSLIYKRQYFTDSFGRHITPTNDSAHVEFAMVTGCSFAFGYAVEENQTLSFYLDSLTGMHGYNYGISGHGTQQTLSILQSRNLRNEISEPNGLLIHLFIDHHVKRLIGSRKLIRLWASDFPYFYLDGENLKQDGSFISGRKWQTRFYRAISQSAFIDLFDIDFPWYISDGHMRLFGAVLRQAKQEFLEQYPNGRFLVVIGPNETLAPRVKEVLQANDVEVLDCSNLLDKGQKQYKVHWTEAHPNARYYRELAVEIKRYIEDNPQ